MDPDRGCCRYGDEDPDRGCCRYGDEDPSWWHCYTLSPGGRILAADVEAPTAEEAATIAAEKHHLAGGWTVVPGRPVKIAVKTSMTYTARRV